MLRLPWIPTSVFIKQHMLFLKFIDPFLIHVKRVSPKAGTSMCKNHKKRFVIYIGHVSNQQTLFQLFSDHSLPKEYNFHLDDWDIFVE